MRSLLVIVFFFIIATVSYEAVETSDSCIVLTRWHIFVRNDIPENIVLHVKSKDDDLGNGSYDWSFCNTLSTLFYSDFWWAQNIKL